MHMIAVQCVCRKMKAIHYNSVNRVLHGDP